MTVYTLTRRTGRGPGDEVIEVIHVSEPMSLDLEPVESEWSTPSRLPRHREPAGSLWMVVVVVLFAAMAAAVWGVL